MHWFWRATIAVVLVAGVVGSLVSLLGGNFLAGTVGTAIICSFSILLYAGMEMLSDEKPKPNETRCRKCHHILRGITEPRCPECGERI